jgi:hypothetical protein
MNKDELADVVKIVSLLCEIDVARECMKRSAFGMFGDGSEGRTIFGDPVSIDSNTKRFQPPTHQFDVVLQFFVAGMVLFHLRLILIYHYPEFTFARTTSNHG